MSDLQNVERLNFYRLSQLILDVGTHALQSLFEKEYSATGDLQTFLNSKNHILNKLYRKKIIKQTQKELIQPSNGTKPILEKFDISLVSTLLTNLCSIAQPLAGWAVSPQANDISTGADVLRLRTARNELFAHRTKGSMGNIIFEKGWIEIDQSILRLSNQLDLKKQEQIRDQIANVKIAHINWERETQINGQLFDKRLCDILQKLEEIRPERLEVISSDGVEDAINAEIPEGPDGVICVLKEYPKLKSELTKDSVEAITQFMLESKLINRASYDRIKESSCIRTVFIDRLLKMVVQGKPELLECFFSELKMECPHLAIALSKMEVTQEDRDKYHLAENKFGAFVSCRIKLDDGIDESDISFFQNQLYDYPEVIDGINDKLLSQFLISLCEHSKVSYSQDPDKKICALFETMQRHLLPVESVLQDALQPTLFKKWKNFRINKLHQKVLQICLPIFERKLDFEMVFTHICQTNLFDNSFSSKLTKQATKSDKTKMLLCFLQERDRSVYDKFKECLILSKQYMLKKVLEEEELKLSQGMKTEDTTGNECYWRALLQWISAAATSVLAHFSRHFQMRFIGGENGSIILKFVALKDFKVELLNQSDVQKHLEKLLRKGCLDSKIKVDGPVYVTVYILSPGDEGMEEYIHFHLDFEAFHAQKESKAQLESHEINLLVEELNPSQLHCWTFDQPQIGMDCKEKMEAILSQRGLSRREKMELLLDIIIRLENGHGTLEKFCEENDKYVYDKVFRKSKQMDPKNSLSYQKGGGRQKLYSMWINIDEGEPKGIRNVIGEGEGHYEMAGSKIRVVCSIDLGTTYSGYAFSFKADYERNLQNVSMNSWEVDRLLSEKVLTAVLLDPNQVFHSFGYEAEKTYAVLSLADEHHDWYYFNRFKMMLHKQKDLKREAKIETQDGKVCKAKKIFTFSIKYLKEHMEEAMKTRGLDIRADEMAWVITLPAIWTDSAKQFMREAATDAGIPGKQLTLALEPESASIFCQKISSNKFVDQDTSVSTFIEPGKRYVVMDLGGGTADITVHKIGPLGDIHELRSPSGGAWGGTRVDEEFRQFIVSVVGQDVWTEFMHKQMYDYLDMFREFETKKKTISTDTSTRVIVKIPYSLIYTLKWKSNTTMQKALDKAGYKGKAEYKVDKLFVNADFFKSFFSSAVDSIISHLKEIFKDPASEDPPLVLMVGGFSDSKFVQERLKAAFPTKKFVVPLDAGLAVLKGSVMFGFQPEVIRTRVCQKTYGISFHKPYIPGVHPENKRTVIDGDVLCSTCFLKFVTVGEKLEVGDKREHSFIDNFHSNERKKLTEECHIYTSPSPDPMYIDEMKCEKLGTIHIYPPLGGWPPEMHGRVVMEFGRTEFRVTVYDETNKREFESSFDFLK